MATKLQIALQEHKQKWADCMRCQIGEWAFKHVTHELILQPTKPTRLDLLFIGEAPGDSEDVKGIPFCGVAGKFLRSLIESIPESKEINLGFTNIIICKPTSSLGSKFREPEEEEILNCEERLIEFLRIV